MRERASGGNGEDVFQEIAFRPFVQRTRQGNEQIENGVDFLIPCGTTGEAVTLSDEEYATVLRTVVAAADGKVPVIAGAGSNSTGKTIETSTLALQTGAELADGFFATPLGTWDGIIFVGGGFQIAARWRVD